MTRTQQRAPPQRKHPTLTEIVAHWKLNETLAADNAIDASANNIDLDSMTSLAAAPGPHRDGDHRLGYGARTFDDASYFVEPAGNEGASAATLQSAYGYTIGAWVYVDAGWSDAGCIVTYDAFGGAEDQNIQVRFSLTSAREVFVRWEEGSGNNVDTSTGYIVPTETWTHLALVVTDDDTAHLKRAVILYVNGEPYFIERDKEPPTGGADAYWQIGASFDASTDAGATPSIYFDGLLSDIAIYPFTGSPEFCRDLYARAIKDFQVSADVNFDGSEREGASYYDETLEHISVFTRVKVKLIPGGSGESEMTADKYADVLRWVDLTNIDGHNVVLDATIEEDVNSQAASASCTFSKRIKGEYDLGSLATRGLNASDYDDIQINPLYEILREGHEIKIEFSAMPHGSNEEDAKPFYMLRFHGIITQVGDAADDIKVQCIDLMQALQDQWVEPSAEGQETDKGDDYQYGSPTGVDIEDNLAEIINDNNPARIPILHVDDTGGGGTVLFDVFQSSLSTNRQYGRPHLFTVNDVVRSKATGVAAYNGIWTVASVTDEQIATVETVAPTAAASPSAASLYGIESKFGYVGATPGREGSIELYVPASPGWLQRPYNVPSTMNVATALEEQAAQIGWVCRYLWDNNRKQYRLTLYDPTVVESAGFIHPGIIVDSSEYRYSSDNKRNVIVTEYLDNATALPDGGYKKSAVMARSITQITRHRRRYARMGLFNATNIDSSTEAQSLANIALESMKDADADEFSVVIPFNDRWDVGATAGLLGEASIRQFVPSAPAAVWPYSGVRQQAWSRTLVVAGLQIKADVRGVLMTLKLRSLTSGGVRHKFRDLITERGRTGGMGNRGVNGGTAAPTTTTTAGQAFIVQWSPDVRANVLSKMYSHTEVHISTTNGFTPSSSTLAESTSALSAIIKSTLDGGLTVSNGNTYYFRCIHVDQAGNRVMSDQATDTMP